MGFVNEEGEHTNTIENLWSHLKSEIRKGRGVARANIDDFLIDFKLKKMFKMNTNETNLYNVFLEFLRLAFEE